MPSACGQNVYNVGTGSRTTCQCSSTVLTIPPIMPWGMWVNTQVIRSVIPTLPLFESTLLFRNIYLLVYSFTHNPQALLLPPQEKI